MKTGGVGVTADHGMKGLPRLWGLPVLLWGEGADRLAGWLAPAFAFAVPISVSADAILLGAIAALVLSGGRWREKLARLQGNPPALAALGLFLLLAIGTAWSEAPWPERLAGLGRYIELAAITLLLPVFAEPRVRRRALFGFLAAMLITLLLSVGLRVGWIPIGRLWHDGGVDAAPFRPTITQGVLMGYAAFLAIELAGCWRGRIWRYGACLFAAAAAADVLFLVPARTGYVVLGVLMLYAGHLRFGWRGAGLGLAAAAVLFLGAYALSPVFHGRLDQAVAEADQSSPDKPAETSVGLRLEFWRNTLAIIGTAPLIGHGTGSFAASYARLVEGTGMEASRNPHNDLLHLAAQLGLLGALALAALYVAIWRSAARLPEQTGRALARGLVLTYAAGGLFNTLLMDHTEGRLFALFAALLFAALPARRGASVA